jgi:hypothetical protein
MRGGDGAIALLDGVPAVAASLPGLAFAPTAVPTARFKAAAADRIA